MFTSVRAAIRAYIITRLAEIVADEIAASGLTDEEKAVLDAAMGIPPANS